MKKRYLTETGIRVRGVLTLLGLGLTIGIVWGQVPPPDPPEPLASLKTVAVPEPPNLGEFVQDKAAAIRLGKALFWDMQVGSDGITACASCHFHAGADNRAKNQLSPGLLAGDTTFQIGGPNYTLQASDFPFTKHADENARAQDTFIISDSNDVASSQGVLRHNFVDVLPPLSEDQCERVADPVFHVRGVNTRRVEPRNTPTVINAVFNFRNFWDGRANQNFNGVNPFGQRDPNAHVFRVNPTTGQLEQVSVVIPLASLASQAVGPPLSAFEMSCAGRIFPKIGRKLLYPLVVPLGKQTVHPNDSILGHIAGSRILPGVKGLTVSYAELIKKAFRPEWWSSSEMVTLSAADQSLTVGSDLTRTITSILLGPDTFTQMEANFSLFWGLAIQLYEATLIASDTRVDRFLEGNTGVLTALEQEGLNLFDGVAQCSQCHGGAELTNASVANVSNQRLERMIMGDGGCAIYDNGFYNIGARPTAEDLGVGDTDPFGNPLSETRMAMQGKFVDPNLDPPLGQVPECDNRANVDGAFKTPSLRNVELTGPYFHNGGKATLRQVVDFYNRGGDFAARNIANLDPDIQALGLTEGEKNALVAFLVALTDERVRWKRAPFDHPELCIPDGHTGDQKRVTEDPPLSGEAKDDLRCIPAVGADGASAPLQPFLGLSPFDSGGESAPPSGGGLLDSGVVGGTGLP